MNFKRMLAGVGVMSLLCLSACSSEAPTDVSATMAALRENADKGIAEKTLTADEQAAFMKLDRTYLQIDNSVKSVIKEGSVKVESDGSFYDDFSTGIDPNVWEIAQRAWGGNNHGVNRLNVAYTADGNLLLTANGDLYEGPLNLDEEEKDGVRSGACIVTKESLGPGSYEVRMKALPHMGACTAMWTFFYGNGGHLNHEIDIEIPADRQNFANTQFVTWTSEEDYTDRSTTPAAYHNDGQWHTYRFDWHTEPARVDFYVDGKLEQTIEKDVPNIAGNFWLGVWFPNGWSGTPLFDTGYMLVDYVRYTAFDEPHTANDYAITATPAGAYPTEPKVLPVNNFISNGTFEVNSTAWSSVGDVSTVENPDRGDRMLSLGADALITQNSISIVPESEYLLSLSAATVGRGEVQVQVEYLKGLIGNDVLGSEVLFFKSKDFTQHSKALTTPADCNCIRLTVMQSGERAYIDDMYLTQPARDDFNIVK